MSGLETMEVEPLLASRDPEVSLARAQEFMRTIGDKISSMELSGLTNTLNVVDRISQEYPELDVRHIQEDILNGFLTNAKDDAISLTNFVMLLEKIVKKSYTITFTELLSKTDLLHSLF